MGNSTTSLQDIIDAIASRGSVNPQANPSGYNLTTCLAIAQDTMNDIIARRFNWKWNSGLASPFLTNPFQQDYPQLALSTIGWLEDAWSIDINSSTRPLPKGPDIAVDRDLSVSTYAGGAPRAISWMYNRQLSYGRWPGAAAAYANPVGAATPPPNGPTAFVDVNGNILLLTAFGTTGTTAPAAPGSSLEGVTVQDGTCVWTVVNPNGQGFRLDSPPASGGPVWQIYVKFQESAPKFTSITQLIDPLPDDFAHHFRRGFTAGAHDYSPDPKAQAAYPALHEAWIQSMSDATAQGDREADSFMLVPATQVAEPAWGRMRNPRDPGRPY